MEEVEWTPATDGGRPTMNLTGKKEVIEADMVLLAMGCLLYTSNGFQNIRNQFFSQEFPFFIDIYIAATGEVDTLSLIHI